jgi:AdoMet-dependent heme synthase
MTPTSTSARPANATISTRARSPVDFADRPMLVFWETTRACPLACRHCRASAQPRALPGELSRDEGHQLIDQVAGFGRPYPILILTGGDCLARPDLFQLIGHARSAGIPVALSPSVTPALSPGMIGRIADSGVKAVSVSLDGAAPATHDGVRGIGGHFRQTIEAVRALVAAGLPVQVNTTVMGANVAQLARIAGLLDRLSVHAWEVFFLVQTGRGTAEGAVTPGEHDDVCHFLYDASRYGFVVRTVEAPFFRRVAATRRAGEPPPQRPLYQALSGELARLVGSGARRPRAHTAATRDGKGIVFIAHNGDVFPAGFLPLTLGNVRHQPLARIYREDPLLRAIREARFGGRCGQCPYADLCGGSRARAYAATGDPLAEDPACPFQPGRQPVSLGG